VLNRNGSSKGLYPNQQNSIDANYMVSPKK